MSLCVECGGEMGKGWESVHATVHEMWLKRGDNADTETKHDGKIYGGDTYEVYYDGIGKDTLISIQGTHNLSNYEVVLEPKQALSLLAWLKQEEATLQQLVEETKR